MTDMLDNLVTGNGEALARFDPTRTWRYTLTREWRTGSGRCLWIMLNPSTADEFVLDPTIRRCVGFARAWGFQSIEVANLFALRSTDPRALYAHADPIGRDNDYYIEQAATRADRIVCAWGAHGAHLDRGRRVAAVLACVPKPVVCLGLTKDGHPKHPLYLANDTTPKPFYV
jgi:hypothetical protein